MVEQVLPKRDPRVDGSDGVSYLLADYQVRVSKADKKRYQRYATHLSTLVAVEKNSTISINFDPSFETVTLHHIHVVRDGVATDRLDLEAMQIYRVETERDRLIYNGDLEMAYIVPDVRIGDILDYSFTITGANPAWGPHFTFGFDHQYSVPVARISNRVLIENGIDYVEKAQAGAAAGQVLTDGDFTVLEWFGDAVPALSVETDRPYWHFGYPITQISSFRTWGEAGQHLVDAYDVTDHGSEAIRAIAVDIRRAHNGPKAQLRAALDYVQSNVRYLGIELGAGGYIPRHPDLVLRRRFGDCKDMTVLLLALLQELGIKAAPMLANLDDGLGLKDTIPSIGAFDHVLVSAWLGEEQYFLDATKGKQLGDMDHLDQGDYGYGLLISAQSDGLIRAQGRTPEFNRDFEDKFDLNSDPSTVYFSSKSTYRGDVADRMVEWIDREGRDWVEEVFFKYYEEYYPTLEQIGPFAILVDEAQATVSISAFYQIPDAWDTVEGGDDLAFNAYAGELASDMPEWVEGTRKAPFVIDYPVRTRHVIEASYPPDWTMEAMDQATRFPAFEAHMKRSATGQTYRNVFSYVSKSNQIAAEDFAETMSAIETLRETAGVQFTYTPETPG